MDSLFKTLMALRVQGISSPERVAAALCVTTYEAAEQLGSLTGKGLAEERTGRLPGFMLTADGSAHLDQLLEQENVCDSVALKEAYDRFLRLNDRVLKVSSDWQVRRIGGTDVPNDHSDPAYDELVIDRLAEIHDGTRACLRKVTEVAPRFGPYAVRLDSCIDRLYSGDRTAFTAPLVESYHTIWFELHQDLLLTLGLEREG